VCLGFFGKKNETNQVSLHHFIMYHAPKPDLVFPAFALGKAQPAADAEGQAAGASSADDRTLDAQIAATRLAHIKVTDAETGRVVDLAAAIGAMWDTDRGSPMTVQQTTEASWADHPFLARCDHYSDFHFCRIGCTVAATKLASAGLEDYIILHVGESVNSQSGEPESISNLWYLVSPNGRTEAWAAFHVETRMLRRVATRTRDALFEPYFTGPEHAASVAVAAASKNVRTVRYRVRGGPGNRLCIWTVSMRFVPRLLFGRLKKVTTTLVGQPDKPKPIEPPETVRAATQAFLASGPVHADEPDYPGTPSPPGSPAQQPPLPPPPPPPPRTPCTPVPVAQEPPSAPPALAPKPRAPRRKAQAPPPPAPAPEPAEPVSTATRAPAADVPQPKRQRIPGLFERAAAAAVAQGPPDAEAPVTALNLLRLLEHMHLRGVPLDGGLRFGQVSRMGDFMQPADDRRGATLRWLLAALRLAYDAFRHTLTDTSYEGMSFEETTAALFLEPENNE